VIANIDFLVVGLVFSDRALAVYVLAFRVSNAIPSQVAFVASRVATVDLASQSTDERNNRYRHFCSRLFAAGLAGAALTVVAAPILEGLLGPKWHGLAWCLTLLVVAAPWRVILGLAGTLAIISAASQRLLRWELVRLCVFTVVVLAAASAGFPWLVLANVALTVGSVLVLHRLAGGIAGVAPWNVLPGAAVATSALLGGLLWAAWGAIGSLR
jgi:O-antigen/teichoic acid export membrane protein